MSMDSANGAAPGVGAGMRIDQIVTIAMTVLATCIILVFLVQCLI